jgi:predicted HD phosphohydrolase
VADPAAGPATTGPPDAPRATAVAAVDEILAPLRAGGGGAYLGESVTQLDHALQTAWWASEAGAPPALVVAALLHDIGWLVGGGGADGGGAGGVRPGGGDDHAAAGADHDHAAVGADHLRRWLPPSVTEPVRLHVQAKRWLCATSPAYVEVLSPASRRTLERQGGCLDRAGTAVFEREPWADAAVRLRRWDDEAKVPGRPVPGLETWRPVLEALTAPPSSTS